MLTMDNRDKEIDDLKQRIANLEDEVRNPPRRSNLWRFSVGFIIVFVAMTLATGIFQFIRTP